MRWSADRSLRPPRAGAGRAALRRLGVLAALGALAVLAGCAAPPPKPQEATLGSLAGREAVIAADPGLPVGQEQAIAAYRGFVASAPQAPQSAEARRRLGDLEMDDADRRAAEAGSGTPDYRAAVERYRAYLAPHPGAPGNDRVLYQVARAQELGGDAQGALATLDRLIAEHPKTIYYDEVQFRRGELLFGTRHYARAERAYTEVLGGDSGNPYRERALYMQGWSLFKQGRLEDGLNSFLALLDRKIAGPEREDAGLDAAVAGLSAADRELVEDTLRVTGISLAGLDGAESIAPYMDKDNPRRRSYEPVLYGALAALYIKQERVKDAADTFGLFARRHPLHAQAPLLQVRAIEVYEAAGFMTPAVAAKKDYVARYGAEGEFRAAKPLAWKRAQPTVKRYYAELARHHHAAAQKSKASADYQEAVRWYRGWLAAFPDDDEAANNGFLLAELLFEDKRYAEAAREYEHSAYGRALHPRSADAGYAALLAHAEQEKRAAPAARPALQREAVASALRFADRYAGDARAGAVLGDAAEKLYALREGKEAARTAERVLALQPAPPAAQRRVAWTVLAHTAFEREAYPDAERAYGEALGLLPAKDGARNELVERLAASIYRQGEQARTAGRAREAVQHFERVAVAAPASPVRATAQYDAAAALIGLKDWEAAARTLEDFRKRYPGHALQGEVDGKLAAAYLEQAQWGRAAAEFERVAAAAKEPQLARGALWQAAELHEKAAEAAPGKESAARAARAWERYVQRHPQPLEPALEARWRLALLARAEGNQARELALMKDIVQAERGAGGARSERMRALGAGAALALAAPALERYRKVALVEPLARQLALKKAGMEEALAAYGRAADYGVAEVTTAATFRIASLYQDFGKALLGSQRPAGLSKAEREQYDVLLEEQAFPFEEKAIELFETNARRARLGHYDEWVRRSYAALGELRPVRYGKAERSEAVIDEIR